MTDYKNLVYIGLTIAVIVAIILKDKIKASFLGFKINASVDHRKNKAVIKGSGNSVVQSGQKNAPPDNNSFITGNENQLSQE